MKAVRSLRSAVRTERTDPTELIADIIRHSTIARRGGFIALEAKIPKLDNRFFQKALQLAVDGMFPKLLVETMEQDSITFEDERRRIAKVFETAGGFAPTIGILGAVLGLIHVMENLADPAKLGAGIAVAFVATIYGVGTANLIFLPISRKLVNQLNRELAVRAMILEGVVGIQSGAQPALSGREAQGLCGRVAKLTAAMPTGGWFPTPILLPFSSLFLPRCTPSATWTRASLSGLQGP